MPKLRLRQAAPVALVAILLLMLSACGLTEYPNTTFHHNTEFNSAVDALFDRLVFWGTIVFVVVEVALVVTIIKFRKRPGGPAAKPIHGNAALEITWTVIPALILVLIAIPTVKTIFETQAEAPAGAIKVEVIGHQWWWEFRYPELGVVTANELYLPVGRTAAFVLTTDDVLHSFWIPQMGGKRDLIRKDKEKANHLWFTPSADLPSSAWNGFCAEYCGSSHANMKFRLFTVQPAEFESWARHQASPAVFSVPAAPVTPVVPAAQVTAADSAPTPAIPTIGYVFPKDRLEAEFPHVIPQTPIPAGIRFDDALLAAADPVRGYEAFASCSSCHAIQGTMYTYGVVGPNLTHIASRHTIAGGLYRNDAPTLARWIKNARHLKPGSIMNTLGKGEYDPILKTTNTMGLDDRQIADVVAYLMALK